MNYSNYPSAYDNILYNAVYVQEILWKFKQNLIHFSKVEAILCGKTCVINSRKDVRICPCSVPEPFVQFQYINVHHKALFTFFISHALWFKLHPMLK